MTTRILDQRYMRDAEPQQKPSLRQLRQRVLALLSRGGISGIDIGDSAGDDQTFRVSEQETGKAERFITQCLRIPKRAVAKFLRPSR